MDEEPRSEVIDTHVSNVILVDDFAFKRKRPVRTEFIDLSSAEKRGEACRREVELNSRLSPDVYLGVADVTLNGERLDQLVVMRRLPGDRRLSALLEENEAAEQVRRIARLIAAFHGRARRGPDIDAAADRDAVRGLWHENVTQLAELGRGLIDGAEIETVSGLAQEYLDGRQALFDRRIADGRMCDGHGDLQASDVFCMPDGPRVLDCIEFADRYRFGDVLADVGFLAMDLERLGHPELGRLFLDTYRAFTGDDWPPSLEHHHVAYRAHVRAKVACMRSHQGSADAAAEATALHALALRHLEAGRVSLAIVGGIPGSGKSTLAQALAERIGAVVLSSDAIRDEVEPRAGGPVERSLGTGRYRHDKVDHVYDEMLRRAELLLGRGEHVVLDASWLDPARRGLARALAGRSRAHLTELRCVCPRTVAEARISARRRRGSDPSEVTVDLARQIGEDVPPWPEAHDVETTISVADAASVADVLTHRV